MFTRTIHRGHPSEAFFFSLQVSCIVISLFVRNNQLINYLNLIVNDSFP